MSTIERFHKGSFRGIDFLVPDESAGRGKKIVVHEYPNSNKRYVEELGLIPPIMDLNCMVSGTRTKGKQPPLGESSFFEHRSLFEWALEKPGLGRLEHPVYGVLEVQAGPYTVSSKQTDSGMFIFNVKFYASDSEVSPKPLPPTKKTVSVQKNKTSDAIGESTEKGYNNPFDSAFLDEMAKAMNDALDAVQDAIDSIVGPLEEGMAFISNGIQSFRNKINRIMQTAAGFKNAMISLESQLNQLAATPDLMTQTWNKLIEYDPKVGDESISDRAKESSTSTVKRQQTTSNKNVIKESINMMGMTGSFESAAYTEYSDSDKLTESISYLDEKFKEFFNKEEVEGIYSQSADSGVRGDMMLLRNMTTEAINAQLTSTYRLTTLNPGLTSFSLMAFRYYGNLDPVEKLIELNPDTNQANFNKEIKAITE